MYMRCSDRANGQLSASVTILGYVIRTKLNWRFWSNWAKERPFTLRLADKLGRGKGRLRIFDHLFGGGKAARKPDLTQWHKQELAAAWIGHATVLLRIGGM